MKKRKNLSEYLKKKIIQCQDYAALEVLFLTYGFLDEFKGEENLYLKKEQKLVSRVLDCLSALSVGECDSQKIIHTMIQVRDEIKKKMELLTMYLDRLIIFERVLKSKEWSYKENSDWEKGVTRESEEKLIQSLLTYIITSKDRAVMNDKIRQVYGRLPVRMTKHKFLERLRETIRLYLGDERSVLDDFIYRVRTNGMLYEPSCCVEHFGEFKRMLERLERFDYDHAELNEFKHLQEGLERCGDEISAATDFYYSFQKIVNIIYAIAVINPYLPDSSGLYSNVMETANQIIQGNMKEDLLIPFEGKIEQCAEKYIGLEAVIQEMKMLHLDEIKSMNLENTLEDIRVISILLSDDLFLETEEQEDRGIVDDAYAKRVFAELTTEFENLFSQYDKSVKRAIMGNVLEQLPVMVQNTDELKQHMEQSLFQCHDKAEKMSVMQSLREWVTND